MTCGDAAAGAAEKTSAYFGSEEGLSLLHFSCTYFLCMLSRMLSRACWSVAKPKLRSSACKRADANNKINSQYNDNNKRLAMVFRVCE